MAQGGREEDMIRPIRKGGGASEDMCPKHPGDVRKSFCVKCDTLLCIECYHESHEGHTTILARVRAQQLLDEVKALSPDVQRRQAAVADLVKDVQKQRVGEKKQHKDKLDDLRQEYERKKAEEEQRHKRRMKELQAATDEAQDEATELQKLTTEMKDLSLATPISTSADLKPRVQAVLQKSLPGSNKAATASATFATAPATSAPGGATSAAAPAGRTSTTYIKGLQAKLLPLVTKAKRDAIDYWENDYVAVTTEGFKKLADFAEGRHNTKPSSLRCPQHDKAYKCGGEDVTFIPGDTGRQLASLLRTTPTVCCRAGKCNRVAIESGGTCSHVYADVYQDGIYDSNASLWLPFQMTVAEAIHRGTGVVPVRVRNTKLIDVPLHQTVKQWLDTADNTVIYYWTK